jgi:hypothetical protein
MIFEALKFEILNLKSPFILRGPFFRSIFATNLNCYPIREFVKNNLPILTILFPLLCVDLFLNNSLFLE